MESESLWLASAELPEYPPLARDLRVDVLVIGAGITGLTAAYLLQRAGKKVAVVDRYGIGSGETGHTTAHLTYQTDERLSTLVSTFGRDGARAAWDAGAHAIGMIRAIALEAGIECELRASPGFLVAAENSDLAEESRKLAEEAAMAGEFGFDVRYLEHAPLLRRPAIRFSNQAKFHPLKYLAGLAREFVRLGGEIFGKSEAGEFSGDSRSVRVGQHRVDYEWVVIATHQPLQGAAGTIGAALFQTKLAAYSTYAVEARVPAGTLPEMMWWDTANPYDYLRVDRHEDSDLAIYGGADHKTGQKRDTAESYQQLIERLTAIVPSAVIEHRWSGQVLEPVDGLPYIGEMAPGQFIGTGYAGNGMTFGTIAGIMARDHITGVRNPWSALFDPHRKKLSATWEYLRENKDYPMCLISGLLRTAEPGNLSELGHGEGRVIVVEGHKIAAYRDEKGEPCLLSPICPHMGCIVNWNAAEQTWDCPCHGSRFTPHGEVISGPAESPLEPAPAR